MSAPPGPRGPTGAQLLAGTAEAPEYCRAWAPLAFPDGLPSAELAAALAVARRGTSPGRAPRLRVTSFREDPA
ncbi:MAG TPA: hypothetical protein VEK76_12835 [Candidatus Binatia bacterium]|nr:hypothetical protein [Candidatus Binatia bacterium]